MVLRARGLGNPSLSEEQRPRLGGNPETAKGSVCGRWRVSGRKREDVAIPSPLVGRKKDGPCSRADGPCWRAEQSWAQDRSWEEGSSCGGGGTEGQGPWQGTDGSSCGGQWTRQEAGCQRLGELLLQGQFRLQ